MSDQFPNPIDAHFARGEAPELHERADRTVRITVKCTSGHERYQDVLARAHVFAAAAIRDAPDNPVFAQDLYLPDEYATFARREKSLSGMVVACLQRQGLIPLEPIPYKSSPRRYRIVPDLIDLDLVHSLTPLRS